MQLEPKHWLLIAGMISGLATQLLTAQHGWSDVLTPGFVAGLLIQTASAITALFVGAPGAEAAMAKKDEQIASATASSIAASEQPVVILNPKP